MHLQAVFGSAEANLTKCLISSNKSSCMQICAYISFYLNRCLGSAAPGGHFAPVIRHIPPISRFMLFIHLLSSWSRFILPDRQTDGKSLVLGLFPSANQGLGAELKPGSRNLLISLAHHNREKKGCVWELLCVNGGFVRLHPSKKEEDRRRDFHRHPGVGGTLLLY